MVITPYSLAKTLRNAASKRALPDPPTEIVENDEGDRVFFVYDNDGGILKVSVTQYKEPHR